VTGRTQCPPTWPTNSPPSPAVDLPTHRDHSATPEGVDPSSTQERTLALLHWEFSSCGKNHAALKNFLLIPSPVSPWLAQLVLDKDSFTLEDLLEEDDVIQECKSLNSRLVNLCVPLPGPLVQATPPTPRVVLILILAWAWSTQWKPTYRLATQCPCPTSASSSLKCRKTALLAYTPHRLPASPPVCHSSAFRPI
jgi:hypothetical protein